MTEYQRLFLVQARSDFKVFTILRNQATLHHCHALHYLQMATELLGKARAWKDGPTKLTHRAFVKFLRTLAGNPKAQKQLGYEGDNASWRHLLRKSTTLAQAVEDLAPALAGDGPNPEYPWPPDAPTNAPTEYEFPLWKELSAIGTSDGRQFITLITALFAAADAYL